AGRDAEMIGPEHDQTLDEAAFGQCSTLNASQGFRTKSLLDDVELRRRRLWRGGGRRHRLCGRRRGVTGRLHRRLLRSNLLGEIGEREIAALWLLCICRWRALGPGYRAGLRRGSARLLYLELILEDRLRQHWRRLQSWHFQQGAVRPAQLGLDEAA